MTELRRKAKGIRQHKDMPTHRVYQELGIAHIVCDIQFRFV